jgi:cbb3-type cytochrome oxidase subunit 3
MDMAYAVGPQGARGMGELFNSVFLFLPLIAIFYFMIFRPQQKQRRELQQMLANLKKGDSIVTRGGIEAVIDINLGSPRILYYRELTDLDQPRAFQPPER